MEQTEYSRNITEQLRAVAMEISDRAEEIVGNVQGNIEMKVSIVIRTDDERIWWPEIQVDRRIVSHEGFRTKCQQMKERQNHGPHNC